MTVILRNNGLFAVVIRGLKLVIVAVNVVIKVIEFQSNIAQ